MRVKKITQSAAKPSRDKTGESDEGELFEMANLFPATTDPPMTVWVSPRGTAGHDIRVKVDMTHGNQMSIANTAIASVRPTPRLIAGRLSSADAQAVFEWLTLNTDILIAYWDGPIDTARMVPALKALSSTNYLT
jgi:hypothetical protein